jgi:hypothetical protein
MNLRRILVAPLFLLVFVASLHAVTWKPVAGGICGVHGITITTIFYQDIDYNVSGSVSWKAVARPSGAITSGWLLDVSGLPGSIYEWNTNQETTVATWGPVLTTRS